MRFSALLISFGLLSLLFFSYPLVESARGAENGTGKKIIVLDPGHCSNDKYKEEKTAENALNILEANALAKLLNANGYDARVYNPNGDGSCKEDDYYLNLQARVDYANEANATLFLAIHQDAEPQSDQFGQIYSDRGPQAVASKQLAQEIGKAVVDTVRAKGKNVTAVQQESRTVGVDQRQDGPDYYQLGAKGTPTTKDHGSSVTAIIRQRNMPGLILENYMKTDRQYKALYPFTDAVALGYCNGIAQYLDKKSCAQSGISAAGGPSTTVSCPIPGGKILTHSYQADPKNGHCSPSYGFTCNCGNSGRRAKAIDITGGAAGAQAVLPQINGQNVTWTLTTTFNVDSNEGGGTGKTFEATVLGDKWTFDTLHLESVANLTVGASYPSGTPIGRYVADHLHATIGKNLKQSARAGTATDCDPNWLPSDFMCDPNQQAPGEGTNRGAEFGTGSNTSNQFCTKVGNPQTSNPCGNQSTLPSGSFPYYCQGDPKFANGNGYSCSMGQIGCGPTSTAMVFSYYGEIKTPKEMYDEFSAGGLINCAVGSSMPSMLRGKTWFEQRGFEVGNVDLGSGSFNATLAKKYIDEGWLIIASTSNYKSVGIGHIFVIQDVDPVTKMFTMRDPANCDYGSGAERSANNVQPIVGSTFIPSWYYAYPVRKKGFTNSSTNTTSTISAPTGDAF